MSVPAADNLRHHARLTSHGAQSVHLEQAATLLEAIDALPDTSPNNAYVNASMRDAHQDGYATAMRYVKALLHPEVQP